MSTSCIVMSFCSVSLKIINARMKSTDTTSRKMELKGRKQRKRNRTVLRKREHRYPDAFVEAVRETHKEELSTDEMIVPSPQPPETNSPPLTNIASPDEFRVKCPGQMRLDAIEKAQMIRQREKALEELRLINDRVRLNIQEFMTADAELTAAETPEPVDKAEKEEKEKKMKREESESESLSGLDEDEIGPGEEADEEDQFEVGDEKDELEEASMIPGQTERKQSKPTLLTHAKRGRILKAISSYMGKCIEREDLMRQMQIWMESTAEEELNKPAQVFPFSPELLLDNLPTELGGEIHNLGGTLERLKNIGDSLGIGGATLLEEKTADEFAGGKLLAKARGPRAKVIYNVEELDSSENWNQAEAEIDKALKRAVRVIPVRKMRLNVEYARKQFLVMSQLMEKKNEVIHQLNENVVDLETELVKRKKQAEDLKKNNKKAKVRAEKFQHQCKDLQRRLNEQLKIIEELNKELKECKKKESLGLYRSSRESMSSLNEDSKGSISVISLVEKPSQQLGPTGEKHSMQSPKSSQTQAVAVESQQATGEEMKKLGGKLQRVQHERNVEKETSEAFEVEFASLQSDKVEVEQERSELEIQLEDVKRENERAVEELNQKVEEFETENKRLTGEIECNEEMTKYQEERLGQFLEEIQSMEERMMSSPPTPVTTGVMSMASPPRRERRKTSLQLGLEPETAGQMVAKVKQQYEAELHELKDYMAKQNLRHQADIRRLDHDHKKDVQNIHKEALQQFRALNRFKDCVAILMDRENLAREAHAIRSHAPLPLDENFGDTRQMLARMAILSSEMLICIELNLSRGLMSKRLEMKDTAYGKMDQSADYSQRTKDMGSMQMSKAKRGSEQFQGQQLELHVWRLLEEGKRQEAMDRVRELIVQISTHEKEIQAMKKAAEESIKKKDDRMKRVLAREAEIKKKNGEQKAIIKNLASIWKSRRIGQKFIRKEDLQRNLKLLEEAMKANEISSDLHQSTNKLIKGAMEFPRKRLIEMVKNYVHFRKMKEIKDNIQRMRMESDLDAGVLQAMREAEERIQKQKETWRLKKEQFIKERTDILERLYEALTKVHEQTGILLTKPMDLIPRLEDLKEDAKEIGEEDISQAMNIPEERARMRKEQLQAQAIRDQPLTSVDGTGVLRDDSRETTWKVMSAFPPAMITTPKLLDIDINRSRFAAHEILTRLGQGSLDKKSVSLPPSTFFFPSLYGYFKRPDEGIRKIRSEPSSKPKNIVRTFRTKVRFLPPIATLYPEHNEKDTF